MRRPEGAGGAGEPASGPGAGSAASDVSCGGFRDLGLGGLEEDAQLDPPHLVALRRPFAEVRQHLDLDLVLRLAVLEFAAE